MVDVEEEIRKACEEVGVDWDSVDETQKHVIRSGFRAEIKRVEFVSNSNNYKDAYAELAMSVARRYLRMWLRDLKARMGSGDSSETG